MDANNSYFLPPMIAGPHRGSLDLILMQPVINYELPPNYIISIAIYWWGRKDPNIIRLKASEDMVKISYKVCCDWKSFRKYIHDTKQIKCVITYEGSTADDSIQKRYKPKIKAGYILGKFVIRDINLNSHDSFIHDFPVVQNNEVIGNITALLFYKCQSKPTTGTNTFISKFINQPTNVPKIEKAVDKQLLPKDNYSTSPKKSFSDEAVLNQVENSPNLSDTENVTETPLPRNVKRSLMPQLFSLVDSGTLQSSDVPLLLQIMEGRSPSVDFSAFQPDETGTPKKLIPTDSVKGDDRIHRPPHMINDPHKLHEQPDFPKVPMLCDSIFNESPPQIEEKSSKPSSLAHVLYLRMDSITINVADQLQPDSPCSSKRFIVKQRSKTGYMVKVSLVNECIDLPFPETFISRQINLGVVTFNCEKLLRLPDSVGRNSASSLRFSVRSHRMGERMGKDLGVAEFPLRTGLEQQIIRCAIWPPDNDNNSSKRPIGFITMATAFVSSVCQPEDPPHIVEGGNRLYKNSAQELQTLAVAGELDKDSVPLDQLTLEGNTDLVQKEKYSSPVALDNRPCKPLRIANKARSKTPQKFPTKQISELPHLVKDLEINIELVEGDSLPVGRLGTSDKFYYPNTYVLLNACDAAKTPIYKGSSHPRWNFGMLCCINRQYLIQTNNHIVLKVYHSLNGRTCSPTDPLLGFVSISLSSLERCPIYGWFPVLNLDGDVCGKIKTNISLSSAKTATKENINANITKTESAKKASIVTPKSTCVEIPVERKSPKLTAMEKSTEYSLEKLKGFMWSNQLHSHLSPSASYVDLSSQPVRQRKPKKVRMKAALNFDLC